MIIKVAKKHIKSGLSGSGVSCPIALAIREQTDLSRFYVSDDEIQIGQFREVTLPRTARRFINRFDTGKVVKPFNFKLGI